MTAHRSWLSTFADPTVLAALFAAARDCAGETDDCDPAECAHAEARMHPIELAEWIEREVKRAERGPTRLDQRENREAGQYRRHGAEMVASG